MISASVPSRLLNALCRIRHHSSTWLAAFSFLALSALAHAKIQWTPVSAEDLAATTSKSGADLEVLLSRHILGSFDRTRPYTENFVQSKVYNAKGVEQISVLHIDHEQDAKVWDIGARVVKPSGTIVELEKKDFNESVVAKTGGYKLKRISFAFPDVAPGDVIEYQWKEADAENDAFLNYRWFYCQLSVPIRDYEFEVSDSPRDFEILWFNCPEADAKKLGRNQLRLHLKNLPAFEAEPLMPAERDFRAWICMVFSHPFLRYYSNDGVWKEIASYEGDEFGRASKPNATIKSKAKALAAGATTPEEKLKQFSDFCQTEITNLDWFKNQELMKARNKRDERDEPQWASETLDKKTGNGADINRLFASLARAAGFEVRPTMNADRQEIMNVKAGKGWLFMNRGAVAVKIGDAWKIYNPGEYCAPAGLLSTADELATLYVCDEDKPWYQDAAAAPPEATEIRRVAHLSLAADGTLDGDVEIEYPGHAGVALKEKWWGKPEADAIKSYQEDFAERVPSAELSEFSYTNLGNREMPVILKYKLHVPGYAETVGARLVLPLNIFESGSSPLFTAETRHYPIMFDYASHVHDEIQIILPPGYTLDAPTAPANVGAPNGFIHAQYLVKYTPKTSTISYVRDRVCGTNGIIAFRPEAYVPIKSLFENINRSDRHSFLVKQKSVAAVSPAGAPTAAAPAK